LFKVPTGGRREKVCVLTLCLLDGGRKKKECVKSHKTECKVMREKRREGKKKK